MSCIDQVFIEIYPRFKKHFQPCNEHVYGLGGKRCNIVGHLVQVPISLGTEQEVGSVLYCTFCVLEYMECQIIIGLGVLEDIDSSIMPERNILEYTKGPAAG